MDECLHWVPGAFRSPDDPENLYDNLMEDTKNMMEARMVVLNKMLETCDDADIRASLVQDIDETSEKCKNLMAMQLDLYVNHRIACKGTRADGNCGIHTLISFCEGASINVVSGPLADDGDMHNIVQQYRDELAMMWKWVSSHKGWQAVWKYFCQNVVDLKSWRAVEDQPKASCEDVPGPSTPQQACSGKLVAGDSPIKSVVVAGPEEQPPKKRRTGKPLPSSETINFGKYFSSFMAEKQMTYRTWVSKHQKSSVLVKLVPKLIAIDFSCFMFL